MLKTTPSLSETHYKTAEPERPCGLDFTNYAIDTMIGHGSGHLLQDLYQYAQVVCDVHEVEEILMQKRSAAIELETKLLGQELPLAHERKLRAGKNIEKVLVAMQRYESSFKGFSGSGSSRSEDEESC